MEVKIARIRKGMTQKQLRELLRISPVKMVAIEKGEYKNLNLALMKRISEILETPIQELFL